MKLACLVVVLLLMPASYAAAQRYPFERTFTHSGPVTLDVKTERGAIDVSVGQPGRVVVTGTVTVRAGFNVPVNAVELAKRVSERPPIVSQDGSVTLRPPDDADERRAVTVAYRVRVPPNTSVIAETDSGALTIGSIDGRVEARTSSSSLTLTRIGGDVRAHSNSGAMSIAHVKGALDVKTDSSSIVARELAGNLTARTDSGRLEVSFAGPGNADVETKSSRISVIGLHGALLARSNSGEINVAGRPAGDWRLSTDSSRIRLDIDLAARDFDLDLSTSSGNVEVKGVHVNGVSEQRRVRATAGAGGSKIEATSHSGSISLRQ